MATLTSPFTSERERVEPTALTREFGTPPPFARSLGPGGSLGAAIYEKYYDQKVSEWSQAVESSAQQAMADEPSVRDAPKWIRVLMSEHWRADRPVYRAAPVANRCLRFWLEIQSAISDVRLNSYVHSENKDYKEIAELATKMSYANWQEEDGDVKLMYTVQHASLGIGYTKVGVNTRKARVTFLPCGSDSVLPICPSLYDIQDSGGIVYKSWKPLAWFWDKFSTLAKPIKPEASGWHRAYPARPYNVPEYTWNAMNPQFRAFFAAVEPDAKGKAIDEYGRVPMAKLREHWFQDDRVNTWEEPVGMGWGNFTYSVPPDFPLYPFGRLICTAGDEERVILYDGPNPHWHGLYPFAELRLRPVVWLFAGMSVFQDLFPLNQAVNQLLADLQDYLKQILNPVTIARDQSLSPDSWEDYWPGKPGLKLIAVNRNDPIGNILHFERPDASGIGVIPNAIAMMLKLFDEQAGLIDSGQIIGKKQVPSGETIEQIQNIRQSVFRLMMRLVVAHMRKVGVMQVSDILQFYNRKKSVAMFGEEGVTWQNFDWDPDTYVEYVQGKEPFRRGREFVESFSHMVTSGAALPAQRQAMAVMASALNARGRMSGKTLYKFLGDAGYPVPDWDQEKVRIIEDMQTLPQPKPGRQRAQK